MARALLSRARMRRSGRGDTCGFTLIEMMIVVIIIGILAALAVVGYRKIVSSSHTSEATGMVQSIRVAQEAYHSETQQYAPISPGIGVSYYYPTPVPHKVTAWGGPCGGGCTPGYDWSMLPVHVDGPVMFGYATTAGGANTNPNPASIIANGNTLVFPSPSATDWFVIGAGTDQDGNGIYCQVYGNSWDNKIEVDHDGE